jgi:glycosyltransferase involved in cell wall biosynthesis
MVAPARYEPYGLSVHEALRCAIPAVISASSGVAEQFPLELRDLLVHDVENTAELAQALLRWHENQDHYNAIAHAVANQLYSRTWDQVAAELVGVVEEQGRAVGRKCCA